MIGALFMATFHGGEANEGERELACMRMVQGEIVWTSYDADTTIGSGLLIRRDDLVVNSRQRLNVDRYRLQIALAEMAVARFDELAHQALGIVAIGFQAHLEKPHEVRRAPGANAGIRIGRNVGGQFARPGRQRCRRAAFLSAGRP